ASSQDTTSSVDRAPVRLSLKELIRPYEMGSDMLLYLVNFERVCEQAAISRNMWSSHLLAVLPPQVANVIAQLEIEQSRNYDSVKAALLQRFRLSSDQLQRKFRTLQRSNGESYYELAYKLETTCAQWLQAAKVTTFAALQELICVEQFLTLLPDSMRIFILDKNIEGLP